MCTEYPTRLVCIALGVSRATLLRRPKVVVDIESPTPRIAVRRLIEGEREETRALLHSDRFADRSPGQIVEVLLDEGRYVCSGSVSRLPNPEKAGLEARVHRCSFKVNAKKTS